MSLQIRSNEEELLKAHQELLHLHRSLCPYLWMTDVDLTFTEGLTTIEFTRDNYPTAYVDYKQRDYWVVTNSMVPQFLMAHNSCISFYTVKYLPHRHPAFEVHEVLGPKGLPQPYWQGMKRDKLRLEFKFFSGVPYYEKWLHELRGLHCCDERLATATKDDE